MIHLQALNQSHAPSIQSLLSDEDVLEMTRLPQPYPENGAIGFIDYIQPRMAAGEEYAFAIHHNNEVVGMCGMMYENDIAQIGYWSGKNYWRQGIAGAAVAQLVDYCFNDMDLDYLEAQTLKRNLASCRLLQKLGFKLQREEANTFPKWSKDELVSVYGLLRQYD